ncbi:MAG: hypothetical protein JXR73_18225 [Candidatus Omnitrophica bacterium]|nr:hypothetical protein [Candidatus Omnitrophota bacterium]
MRRDWFEICAEQWSLNPNSNLSSIALRQSVGLRGAPRRRVMRLNANAGGRAIDA